MDQPAAGVADGARGGGGTRAAGGIAGGGVADGDAAAVWREDGGVRVAVGAISAAPAGGAGDVELVHAAAGAGVCGAVGVRGESDATRGVAERGAGADRS